MQALLSSNTYDTEKESIASMANADALTITPETSAGTAPTSTIRNSGENVNKHYADHQKSLREMNAQQIAHLKHYANI